jgi:hypothetical protein
MGKVLKYTVLVLASFLWFLGCSRATVVYLVDNGYIEDDFRYGDLYRLSNLGEYRQEVKKCGQAYEGQKVPVSLYLAGDSFTELGRIGGDAYAATHFKRTAVNTPAHDLVLKEGKKILVIESVERHFRERFSENPWGEWTLPPKETPKVQAQHWYDWLVELQVPYREEMHESVLFSSDFILKIKEWKAGFQKKYFDKVDPKVGVLDEHLVYELDLAEGVSSVFDPVTEEEIERIVKHINQTRENYRELGFDEVYLSIIPNKSSLLLTNDARYNRLVERIEAHPDLEAPIISVWREFQQGEYYLKGDSHWTCEGQKIWVDKVNGAILSEAVK